MSNQALREVVAGAVAGGELVGVVGLLGARDGVVFEHAAGQRALGAAEPITSDTVMWIASMTKAVTSVAVMQCVERGQLQLDIPASHWLPEIDDVPVLEGFAADGNAILRRANRSPTLRELLAHTGGYGYEFLDADLARYFDLHKIPPGASGAHATLMRPRVADPGTRWDYGIGLDWAGRAVEVVTGKRLGEAFRERIFEPLGMCDSAFCLRPEMRQRLAGMHARKPDGQLINLAFEVNQQADYDMGGHALYSTPQDFLRLLRLLLRGGELDGQRLLSTATVEQMSRNQLAGLSLPPVIHSSNRRLSNDIHFREDAPVGWGLSFLVEGADLPRGRRRGSYGWAGLCNSYFWIDPASDRVGLLMTQVLPFFDAPTLKLLSQFETAAYAT